MFPTSMLVVGAGITEVADDMSRILQVATLIFAGLLIVIAIRAFVGGEKARQQTSWPMAIASLVIGLALIGFALVGLPILFKL